MGFYTIDNKILTYDHKKGNSIKDFKKKMLYLLMCSNENYQRIKAENQAGEVFITTRNVAKDLYLYTGGMINLDDKLVRTYLKELEKEGFITLIKKAERKKGSVSIYKINSTVEAIKSDAIYSKMSAESSAGSSADKHSNFNAYNSMMSADNSADMSASKKEKEKQKENVTCISSSPYTEKVLVKARYRGLSVQANRFNGKCKEYPGNKYIEQNGYTYEIFESEVNRVNNHWRYRQPVLLLGEGENGEDIYESRQPFKEIKVIDENKKTTTDVEVMKRRGYPQACIIK